MQADMTLTAQAEFGLLTPDAYAAWDEYVMRHPHGSSFHLIAWRKTIEESFGYEPRYLVARQDGRVKGVLPLFLVENRFIGKVLLSTPFAVYGGILADDEDVRRGLYNYVRVLGRQLNVDYIELRNAWPEQCCGKPNVSRYVAFSQEVQPDEAALMTALPKKTRNLVRKSLKTPFTMHYGVKDTATLDTVHARNMRRLGTPNFPRRYFDRLLANFGEMAEIREVWLDNQVVAASLNLMFRDQVHTYHAAADAQYKALGSNMFMYYDHLRRAGQDGYKVFDFGRCKRDTGVFEFKKHWNTTMRELPYEIILGRRKELPNFTPANPRFSLAIRIWQRLPMPLARALSRFVFPLFP